MTTIEKLIQMFGDFPGIGPRQAKRFVYFLLGKNQEYIDEFISRLRGVKLEMSTCSACFRYFIKGRGSETKCPICTDAGRDKTKLMLIARDIDMENIERTGSYSGYYFVLGGTVPILEKNPEKRTRVKELKSKLKKEGNLQEIIIAMNANPEGDNTEDYLRQLLKEIIPDTIVVSTLGRGLATGVELEYSDAETLKSALKNRS